MVVMADMLRTLVAACLPGPSHAIELGSSWDDSTWSIFLQLARHHRVSALIAHAQQQGRIHHLPRGWSEQFVKDLHRCRLFHQAASARLQQIEAAFQQASIPVIALKGPRLAEQLYPSAGLRPFEDLDILIDPPDRPRADAALASLGYQPFHSRTSARAVHRFHFHSQWKHPATNQVVELHWRPADTGTLPKRTGGHEPFREELSTEPACMAAYLAVHIYKHGFLSSIQLAERMPPLTALHPLCDVRMIWLFDFALFLKKHAIRPDELEAAAARWNAGPALQAARYLASLIEPDLEKEIAGHAMILTRHRTAGLIKARLLRRIQANLDQPARWPETPWWLKASPATGFRPIRLLDILP